MKKVDKRTKICGIVVDGSQEFTFVTIKSQTDPYLDFCNTLSLHVCPRLAWQVHCINSLKFILNYWWYQFSKFIVNILCSYIVLLCHNQYYLSFSNCGINFCRCGYTHIDINYTWIFYIQETKVQHFVCVCVCVSLCEFVYEFICVCLCVRAVHVCVRSCVRVCVKCSSKRHQTYQHNAMISKLENQWILG